MIVRLVSDPPHGQDTVLSSDESKLVFHVSLESASSQPWQVQLWHNHTSQSEWSSLDLERLADNEVWAATLPVANDRDVQVTWYRGCLSGTRTRPVSFTFRFRPLASGLNDEWRWMNEQQRSNRDGRVIYQQRLDTTAASAKDVSNYVHGIDSQLWTCSSVSSDTPNTLVWSLEAVVPGAHDERSGYGNITLGTPQRMARWMALVRHDTPWLGPRHGMEMPLADRPALLYSFLRDDGLHVIAMAVSGVQDVNSVFDKDADVLRIVARNDRQSEGRARVVISVGHELEATLCAALFFARRLIDPECLNAQVQPAKPTKNEEESTLSWMQEWTDLLSYNTWNGIGPEVTEAKLMEILGSLAQHDIKIGNFVIDDIWQSLDHPEAEAHSRGWTAFEADSKAFPGGLKATIKRIKDDHPHIPFIGVWHALLGYWGGIGKGGDIAKQYGTKSLDSRPGSNPSTKIDVVYDAQAIAKMYEDFYSFLTDAGINLVKTDVQCMPDEVESPAGRRQLHARYYDVWHDVCKDKMANAAVSCMSQTPYCIFRNQLLRDRTAIPVRNSNDYYPDIEDSHNWHIFANSNNSVLTRHLNVLPDWDMFQTKHSWGSIHGAARCLSGGPVTITDPAGRHDVELIRAMTAETCQGRTVILRPSVPGANVQPYESIDEQRLIKIVAFNGTADAGSSFLGSFNCTKRDIREFVNFDKFPGILERQAYIIRSFRSRRQRALETKPGERIVLSCHLAKRDWDVFSAVPIYAAKVTTHGGDIVFRARAANLGLIDKITGPVAIISSKLTLSTVGRACFEIVIKTLGLLAIWIDGLASIDIQDTLVTILTLPIPESCISRSTDDRDTMIVDLPKAWKETKPDNGFSNEVMIRIFWNM